MHFSHLTKSLHKVEKCFTTPNNWDLFFSFFFESLDGGLGRPQLKGTCKWKKLFGSWDVVDFRNVIRKLK